MGIRRQDTGRSIGRFTETVAAKVTPELRDYIVLKARENKVTTSCWVRRLLLQALVEEIGNLEVTDSGDEVS